MLYERATIFQIDHLSPIPANIRRRKPPNCPSNDRMEIEYSGPSVCTTLVWRYVWHQLLLLHNYDAKIIKSLPLQIGSFVRHSNVSNMGNNAVCKSRVGVNWQIGHKLQWVSEKKVHMRSIQLSCSVLSVLLMRKGANEQLRMQSRTNRRIWYKSATMYHLPQI